MRQILLLSRLTAVSTAVLLAACADSGVSEADSGNVPGQSLEYTKPSATVPVEESPEAPAETAAEGCSSEEVIDLILGQINAARAQARNCGSKAYEATGPLVWSCELERAAAEHSADMATVNFFSHTGSDGLKAGDRIEAQGYAWKSWGENIAAGYGSHSAAMQAWLDSPGHCSNIMSPKFAEIGVGTATDSGSDYKMYWTQVFARPAASP